MTEDVQAAEMAEEAPVRGTAPWYEAMGKLMKNREHAQSMISRWTTKLAEFEEAINELSGEAQPQ